MCGATRSASNASFAKTITTPISNFRYDNCLTRTANNDAVKCICIMSCLWIVGWCGACLQRVPVSGSFLLKDSLFTVCRPLKLMLGYNDDSSLTAYYR